MDKEMLTFIGKVEQISPESILLSIDGSITTWVPNSVVEYLNDPIVGKEIEFTVPEWMAINLGII